MKFELNFELKQQRNDTMDEISKLLRGFNALIGATTTTVAGGFCDRSHCLVREREREREREKHTGRGKNGSSQYSYIFVCASRKTRR